MITAEVMRADSCWWPMFYYVIIVKDSLINKEVSKVAVNRDEIQPAIENLKCILKAMDWNRKHWELKNEICKETCSH